MQLTDKWKIIFDDVKKRREFFITVFVLAVILFALTQFLEFVESRDGVVPGDPVHRLFTPVDLTWFIFIVIYAALAAAIFYLVREPERLIFAIQCYIMMIIFRIAAMYLVPFNPPPAMIPLADPFTEYFTTGKLLTKDLFFSGHTATLFILYLTAIEKYKLLFLICTILVAFSVVFQHVHYTVDVIAAFLFAYLSFFLVRKMKEQQKWLKQG